MATARPQAPNDRRGALHRCPLWVKMSRATHSSARQIYFSKRTRRASGRRAQVGPIRDVAGAKCRGPLSLVSQRARYGLSRSAEREHGLIGVHEAGAELIVARRRPEMMGGGHQEVLD